MVEFRADEKTAEKLTEIADTLDISRSDLLLSMVKFALTNHQWARFGLTHKTLPRYEENPMATRKLSEFDVDFLTGRKNIFGEINTPAEKKDQLAFLKNERMTSRPKRVKDHEPAMKRNPATKKFSPAQIAAQKLFAERARAGTLGKTVKRKANPSTNTGLAIYLDAIAQGDTYSESKLMEALEHPSLSASDRTVIRAAIKGASYSHIKLQDAAMKIRNYMGGRKTNPDKSKPRAYVKRVSQATGAPPSKRLLTRRKKALSAPAGYFPNPKVKYTNRAKDMKGDQRVGYAVHMADRPSYHAIAWFSKKDDAVKVAQEASDRTGKQLAVTRVQNYFGAM